MARLDDWTLAAARALGLDPADLPDGQQRLVLDLAREVAHGVTRPAAPVTAYLLGLAVGRLGVDPAHAVATLTRLAAEWPEDGA